MNTKDIEDIVEEFKKDGVYCLSIDTYPNGDIDYTSLAEEVGELLQEKLTTLTQHHEAEVEKAVGTERWNIGAWIEQQDFARKEGERSGDPASVWAVQTVIKQINQYLQALPTKTDKQPNITSNS